MIKYLMFSAVLLLALTGCRSTKMPASDIDIYTTYAPQLAILQSSRYPIESAEKYQAAKVLYENVDFSFIRDTDNLKKIFGTADAHKGKVLEVDALVYQYSWNRQFVRFAFMGEGEAVTSCEVKTGSLK